jgi:hypothetical protein
MRISDVSDEKINEIQVEWKLDWLIDWHKNFTRVSLIH